MGKSSTFLNFPQISKIIPIFPQIFLIFVLILALRVGESPIREGPGYATAIQPSIPHADWSLDVSDQLQQVACYILSGIAPPEIRRSTASSNERLRQVTDVRHPMHGHVPAKSRLKSRKSFLNAMEPNEAAYVRETLWKERLANHQTPLSTFVGAKEELPPGTDASWTEWRCFNRLRSRTSRCKVTLQEWGYLEDDVTCQCGSEPQTMNHWGALFWKRNVLHKTWQSSTTVLGAALNIGSNIISSLCGHDKKKIVSQNKSSWPSLQWKHNDLAIVWYAFLT